MGKHSLQKDSISNYNFILCHYTKRGILMDFCKSDFTELAMVPKPTNTTKMKTHILR